MRNTNYKKLDKNEFYPTPDWAKELLYSMIPEGVKTILDPCCGDGGLDFEDGFTYTLYDIFDYGVGATILDFLKKEPNEKFDCVVLNPPFGQLEEFIEHSFKFSDYILLVSPIRSLINSRFGQHIKDYRFDWRLPFKGFKVLVSIGLFLLDKNHIYEHNFGEQLPEEKTFEKTFYWTETPPDSWFVVNRLTKARAIREEHLFVETDIYAPGDENAFIAQKSSIKTKKGDRIDRNIKCFETKEDALKFISLYKENEEFIRNYIYRFGNTVLSPRCIPDLGVYK